MTAELKDKILNTAYKQELLEGVRHMYSRDERKRWILGELFFATEPIKAFAFTSRFDISEGTLFSDLDALDEWLSEYDVSIIRKPGLGIYLEGEELYLRQAISNAVIAFCEMDRITERIAFAEALNELSQSSSNPLLTFMTPEIVSFSRNEVRRCEERLNVRYMDSSELNLIIRMSHRNRTRCNPREASRSQAPGLPCASALHRCRPAP